MSVSVGTPSGGRRKSLDAEINLVPFIDLLSMCICFLLMTAVWLQIGAMQVKQSHGTDAPAAAQKSVELEIKFLGANAALSTFKQGKKPVLQVKSEGSDSLQVITKLKADLTGALKKFGLTEMMLADARMAPEVAKIVSSVMIIPEKGVNYGDLVMTMDVLRKFQLSNVGVEPNGGTEL